MKIQKAGDMSLDHYQVIRIQNIFKKQPYNRHEI